MSYTPNSSDINQMKGFWFVCIIRDWGTSNGNGQWQVRIFPLSWLRFPFFGHVKSIIVLSVLSDASVWDE